MQNVDFLSIVRIKMRSIILFGLLFAALSFVGFIAYAKNFRVSTYFLIVQTQSSNSQDFYSMLKSIEYLGKVLNESVYSDRFIEAVTGTGKVEKNFIEKSAGISSYDKKGRLEAWSDMVSVSRNAEAGILQIEVLDNNQKMAQDVSSAIATVLTEQNVMFRGGDEKGVEIRVLSGPMVESNPNSKRLIAISLVGFFSGVFLMLIRLYVRDVLAPYDRSVSARNAVRRNNAHNYASSTEKANFYSTPSITLQNGGMLGKNGA